MKKKKKKKKIYDWHNTITYILRLKVNIIYNFYVYTVCF